MKAKTETLANVRVDREMLDFLQQEAAKRGVSVAEVVRSTLRAHLAALRYYDLATTTHAELRELSQARARKRALKRCKRALPGST